MNLIKTDKESLSKEDILNYIKMYEKDYVPLYNTLWQYYIGKNEKILSKKDSDTDNAPMNKIPIAYGRKIVNTYTGYAFRPNYTSYMPNLKKHKELEGNKDAQEKTKEYQFSVELENVYKQNAEPVKTSMDGRNTAIFGVSYEILYVEKEYILENGELKAKAVPRFFVADPREVILIYDYSSEPKKKIGIRFYPIGVNKYKVEVYYKDRVEVYTKKIVGENDSSTSMFEDRQGSINKTEHGGSVISFSNVYEKKWELVENGTELHYFGDVPIIAYYFGDDMTGVISPVKDLIDANDVLFSDSMNEFDRFSNAYLIMKRFGLTDPTKKKEPGQISPILRFLKKLRVFEYLPADAEIKFLTKDMPHEFIKFMSDKLKEEIHLQSHIPDFIQIKTGDMTGSAIDRLMFDFENLVASKEADFDLGLNERIKLISTILTKTKAFINGGPEMIVISHKRNKPSSLTELADVAVKLSSAGFSRWLNASIMPDDIVPNIEVEIGRQREEEQAYLTGLEETEEETTGTSEENQNVEE